jgi:hypothetical protein
MIGEHARTSNLDSTTHLSTHRQQTLSVLLFNFTNYHTLNHITWNITTAILEMPVEHCSPFTRSVFCIAAVFETICLFLWWTLAVSTLHLVVGLLLLFFLHELYAAIVSEFAYQITLAVWRTILWILRLRLARLLFPFRARTVGEMLGMVVVASVIVGVVSDARGGEIRSGAEMARV